MSESKKLRGTSLMNSLDVTNGYLKHSCGNLMYVNTNIKNYKCTCGFEFSFKKGASLSAWPDQQKKGVMHTDWPVRLNYFCIGYKSQRTDLTAGRELSGFRFIGRVTKKLMQEINEVVDHSGNCFTLTTRCSDGRTRISSIHYDYRNYKKKIRMEGVINLDRDWNTPGFGNLPNNKFINERLREFITDVKRCESGEKPQHWGSFEEITVETETQYSY